VASVLTRAAGAAVRRVPGGVLERTAGSSWGLRLLFGALARRFDPAMAGGFAGEVGWALRRADGREEPWRLVVDGPAARASARPGTATAPVVVVRVGVADLVRLAAGELDAGRALLEGRLDLEGDFAVAVRLGPMFGLRSPV
jgi:hypothetical protein